VYRSFECAGSFCEIIGRQGGVKMETEVRGDCVLVKEPRAERAFAVITHDSTTQCEKCHVWVIPDFVAPIVSVEVWIHDEKSNGLFRSRKAPQLENICGVAPRQTVHDIVLRMSSRVKKKRFGYSYTLPTMFGNISFDKGRTQPLFRGIWDWTKFNTVMKRLGIEMEDSVASLVVFSANLGRLIAINYNSTVAAHFASRTGMKIVPSYDDQNNTIRFSRDRNKRSYMNFILNRNGGVNIRFFLENCSNLSEENILEFKEEANALIQTVLNIS